MGRASFSSFCPYPVLYRDFFHFKQICYDRFVFTNFFPPHILQSEFLTENESVPVLMTFCPFFCNIHGCQIQHFQEAVI